MYFGRILALLMVEIKAHMDRHMKDNFRVLLVKLSLQPEYSIMYLMTSLCFQVSDSDAKLNKFRMQMSLYNRAILLFISNE